jgi:hypothetical protein
MTRGLGTAAAAAVQQEVVTRTSAVELLFASGPLRLNGSQAPLIIGGQEYLGVGVMGSISAVSEVAEIQSSGLTLSLAGIPRDVVAIAMAEPYQGRPATVFEVLLDEAGAVIEAIVIFRGRLDQMNIRLGELAQIEVTLEDRLTDMDRPALSRYTPEDQARAHPGDKGLDFVSRTVEQEVIWPSRNFAG